MEAMRTNLVSMAAVEAVHSGSHECST